MIVRWKAVEQYFTVVLFVFQFHPVCNLGKFISFGLGTVSSERVKVAAIGLLISCSSAFNSHTDKLVEIANQTGFFCCSKKHLLDPLYLNEANH